MLSSSMISSSTLHVGRHGSQHSLQQIIHTARGLQLHPLSPDSPQLAHRRHHDTITEAGESACSEDDKSKSVSTEAAVKSSNNPQSPQSTGQHKKGSNASHRDRR